MLPVSEIEQQNCLLITYCGLAIPLVYHPPPRAVYAFGYDVVCRGQGVRVRGWTCSLSGHFMAVVWVSLGGGPGCVPVVTVSYS